MGSPHWSQDCDGGTHANRRQAKQLEHGRGKPAGPADREERGSDVHSSPLHRLRIRLHLLAHGRSTDAELPRSGGPHPNGCSHIGLISVIIGASWILTLVFVYAGFAVPDQISTGKLPRLVSIRLVPDRIGYRHDRVQSVNLLIERLFRDVSRITRDDRVGIVFHRPKHSKVKATASSALTVLEPFGLCPLFCSSPWRRRCSCRSTRDTAPTLTSSRSNTFHSERQCHSTRGQGRYSSRPKGRTNRFVHKGRFAESIIGCH